MISTILRKIIFIWTTFISFQAMSFANTDDSNKFASIQIFKEAKLEKLDPLWKDHLTQKLDEIRKKITTQYPSFETNEDLIHLIQSERINSLSTEILNELDINLTTLLSTTIPTTIIKIKNPLTDLEVLLLNFVGKSENIGIISSISFAKFLQTTKLNQFVSFSIFNKLDPFGSITVISGGNQSE